MADNRNNMSQQPQLCKQGCGFYGSPNFDGMCSKCHKDYVQRKANTTGVMGRASPSMNTNAAERSSLSAAFAGVMSSSAPTGITVDEMRAMIEGRSSNETPQSSRMHTMSVSVDADGNAAATGEGQMIVGGPGSADKTVGNSMGSLAQAGTATPTGGAQKASNRCAQCQKKVGLTGFACRCGGTFCGDHRYSDRHGCQFDYKQRGVEELRKLNPVVVAEKVSKI